MESYMKSWLEKQKGWQLDLWKVVLGYTRRSVKAMLHEAIFLATCLATNVARQVARKISRVTPPATATKCCVASCKKSRNIPNFSQRCETICCVWHVHRNLQRNFVKIRQSKPVFCSQEISGWRRKSCKQYPAGGCKLRKNIANVWHPLCNLQCFSVVIVARQVARKIASCNIALSFLSADLPSRVRAKLKGEEKDLHFTIFLG